MTSNQITTLFAKVSKNEKKMLEPDAGIDVDGTEWIVRWVGDSEIEYMRLFTCPHKDLYLKILEDKFFKGAMKYEIDDDLNDVHLTAEQLKNKIKKSVLEQTNSIRVVPLSELKKGLSIPMRWSSHL